LFDEVDEVECEIEILDDVDHENDDELDELYICNVIQLLMIYM